MKSKFFQNYMKQFDDMPKAFRKSKYIFVYLMVSLAIVNFIVFYVAVNLNSILLAFQELCLVVGKFQEHVQRICASEFYRRNSGEEYSEIFCDEYFFNDSGFLFCLLPVI